MSNVTYRLHHIKNGIAFIDETFDLTDPNGPGLLIRAGQIVDANAEGLVSATRRIHMPVEQAEQRGLIHRD